MGAKAIAEKRIEYNVRIHALKHFTVIAQHHTELLIHLLKQLALLDQARTSGKLDVPLDVMKAKIDEVSKARESLHQELLKVDTFNIPEFVDYQKKMVIAATGKGDIPSMDPMKKAVEKAQAAVDEEFAKWIEKQFANWPSPIKPGMAFKNISTKSIIEIISGPAKATNVNLKGDEAVIYQVKRIDGPGSGSSFPISLKELSPQKHWKYIRV